MLIAQKLTQATRILAELDIDCWLTFVRETAITRDPMLSFLTTSDVTWHSAFLVGREGQKTAIVGRYDKAGIEDLGVYDRVIPFVEGIKTAFLSALQQANPRTIAVNFSQTSEICDGLTHGMYLTLVEMLSEIGYEKRLISSERIVSRLRARKTATELERIQTAIRHTLEIIDLAKQWIRPGRSEKEIAGFMIAEVDRRNLELAWERSHCPAVFTGPDTAEAHYQPTDRKVEPGHVLSMDFGVKFQDYCSDLQRTFYVLEDNQAQAPEPVQHGFDTIVEAIERSRAAMRPGVIGKEIDAVARQYILDRGYTEFPHALGHQVGRFAHDGTALLGPAWEKYAGKPFEPLEAGMVFTLEPRLTVPGRGIATIEEMVVVTDSGAEYLSCPQKELILIGQ